MALSPSSSHKRYISSYETPSSSASPSSSLTLPIRKRYQGTSEPILDTETEGDESEAEGTSSKSEESVDEGPGLENEEAASEVQQQWIVSIEDTAEHEPLGLGYRMARRHALELAEDITYNTYEVGQSSGSVPVQQTAGESTTSRLPIHTTWEDPMDGMVYTDIECVMPPVCEPIQTPASPAWSSSSLPMSPASLTVPSPLASLVTTPSTTIAVDKDEFIELKEFDLLKWDQQVVSELVALRNFARRYGSRFCTYEVVENGATLPKIAVVEGVEKVMPITSAKDKAQIRLEVKARKAVEKRFGKNAATKKTQRNLIKQQYKNFTAPSSEMLDQTFDRLQKLVSQLELLDEKLSQEDVN
ncbi:hypothetical protein Tco_1036760 [Tanacetum coccineum]